MAEKENILELKNVVFSFHTYGGEVQAVRDVSFEVRKGEILGIVVPTARANLCACFTCSGRSASIV